MIGQSETEFWISGAKIKPDEEEAVKAFNREHGIPDHEPC